jgi:predicted dehydrogenase
MNSIEVTEMIHAAKKNKVFLMEAMWTYFFPAISKIRQIISNGDIGEVSLMISNFCFDCADNEKERLIDPKLGGGSLLDIGIYDIAFAQMVYGKEPSRIASLAHLGSTGVDEQASMIFQYDKGRIASMNCSFHLAMPCAASIFGTKGRIEITDNFFHPDKFTVSIGSSRQKEYSFDRLGNGYTYEALEVMQCIRNGKTESYIMPLSSSISFMNTMDKIRQQWKLVYPMEK